jgi:hypothetical protein
VKLFDASRLYSKTYSNGETDLILATFISCSSSPSDWVSLLKAFCVKLLMLDLPDVQRQFFKIIGSTLATLTLRILPLDSTNSPFSKSPSIKQFCDIFLAKPFGLFYFNYPTYFHLTPFSVQSYSEIVSFDAKSFE